MQPFHLAFPINDIESTRKFYGNMLGCDIGRETERWIDFNFFGHQLSAHVNADECKSRATCRVDGKDVPLRHFGIVLSWQDWEKLAERIKSANLDFVIEPDIRYTGKPGEQATFFIKDPSGNGLEFKAFKDNSQIFAK